MKYVYNWLIYTTRCLANAKQNKTKQIIHKKGRYTIKNTMKIKMAAQGLMAFAALLSFLDPASCCEAPLAPADLSSVFASVEDG